MKALRTAIWIMMCMLVLSACSEKKSFRMQKLTMADYRVGRHVLDLPEDFSLRGRSTIIIAPQTNNPFEAEMEMDIFPAKMSKQEFETTVSQRGKELEAARSGSKNTLSLTSERPDGSVLFRVRRIDNAYLSEMDMLVDGTYIRVVAKSYDATYEQVEKVLFDFAGKIVPLQVSSPTDFCVGPVCVKGKNTVETARFVYRSTQRPDVKIDIMIDTYQQDADRPMLARISGDDSLLNIFDLKHHVLRKRELTVAGMRAQEWLGSADMEGNGRQSEYKFLLETLRKNPDLFNPSIHIELTTGQSKKSEKSPQHSLNDDGALQLWDAIVGSVRLKK